MNDSNDSADLPGIDRRTLLKLGAVGAGATFLPGCGGAPAGDAAAAVPPTLGGAAPERPFAAPPMDTVRIGFVGVGGMGSVHVRNLLDIEGVELRAVCDVRPEHAERARDWAVEAGRKPPTLYTSGETDFERMCGEEDLDLVYNATPWEWHVPICVAAMANGKHAATEVPAAYTLEDCWKLVEYAETHEKHCVMMENVNYGRSEMLVFHMARLGMFGDILHGEGGYLHDLRGIKFASDGEGLWRRDHAMVRNGNLYPTHGLGPIANCMDINRGDRFDYLVSMSGPSRGLQEWAQEHWPMDGRSTSRTTRISPVRIPASTSSRVPAGFSRGIPTGSTSRDGVRSTSGSRPATTSKSSNTRSGRRWRVRGRGGATEAWTTWRTIASSVVCATERRPT